MTLTDKGCEGCKFLCRQDDGYSNWTPMDCTISCLKKANPALPLDDSIMSETMDKALAFGETCPHRVQGDGPWFDVDGEVTIEDFKNDPEVYALLKANES